MNFEKVNSRNKKYPITSNRFNLRFGHFIFVLSLSKSFFCISNALWDNCYREYKK